MAKLAFTFMGIKVGNKVTHITGVSFPGRFALLGENHAQSAPTSFPSGLSSTLLGLISLQT